ncbi:alpha/beta hydrolase [Nocardioides marmoribigeumensis]|uniref:Acetyl esterase/lipase n=1 Tax=Nocardioides marmoribigeumensis TaxID=433649 RepID=A0ABU2C1U8_9ACTN|nr:alpha/beta hydrolase [Nocardioides marmoribigeumensis]MDR7364620.1 acetyl esterase/lipase [Nocardioides marmoribigeumensis]
MSYLRRQLVTSALVANAIRPVPGTAFSVPAMFGGWLVSELAPHFIAGTAVDTALEVTRRGKDPRHAVLGLANMAVLGYLMRQGGLSGQQFNSTLRDALGEGYRADLLADVDDLDWKTPLTQLVWPFRPAKQSLAAIEVHKNVPYAAEHGRRGLLDVYKPKGDVSGAPVLLQVHGGGWTIGNKDQQGLPLMRHLAAHGWVCVAINYRLSPRDRFPAHLVDVKRAIAWIRQHVEEYGGDPGFVAITGGSAGGHLTALAALTPNDPEYQPGFEDADTTLQAAVPFYGVYDMAGETGLRSVEVMRDRFLAPWVFRTSPDDDALRRASPITRVNEDAPPFYVIHGTNDVLADVRVTREFVERLREVSKQPVAYTELSLTQHAFDVFPSLRSQHSVRGVDRFLRAAHARHRDATAPARRTPTPTVDADSPL